MAKSSFTTPEIRVSLPPFPTIIQALSTPYLDASGAGQVITLSKAIFEGAVHSGPFTDSDPVAGVAGMDFSYETFEDIFLQTVPCPGTSRCWLMDYSGYLVTYDTFLGASNPATFENVFIGEREKPFFDRMLADQFFVRQDFENYETFESCFYYEVDLDAFPSGYSATVSGAGCRSGTIYAVAVPNTQVCFWFLVFVFFFGWWWFWFFFFFCC